MNQTPLRALPATTLAVFPICLGSAFLGAVIDKAESFALLDAYVAAGGNFIDTAKVYSDWIPGERSRSEKLIGEWMTARGNRNAIVLATKGAHPPLSTMTPRMSAQDISDDVHASLSHLRVHSIDLYWLHRDDPATPINAIIDALNTHVRAGKLRYLGCSNWRVARIREANAYAAASGQAGFVASQPMWSAAVVDPAGIADKTMAIMDAETHAFHNSTQLACVPFSSQAGGLFTKLGQPPSAKLARAFKGGPRAVARAAYIAVRGVLAGSRPMYPVQPNQRRRAAMLQVAQARGLTLSQVVLGYLIAQPFPTIPIVGCRTQEQLHDSLTAIDAHLSAADLAVIDAAG